MSFTREEWKAEQHWEADWWGDVAAVEFAEKSKQLVYAKCMGLQAKNDGGVWPIYDLPQRRIVDIGGGPASILLNVRGADGRMVVDPCDYPLWTELRYEANGVDLLRVPAEDFDCGGFHEALCYNVLQHTHDPERIVTNMRAAEVVRIFEWVDFPPSPGHPHELKADALERWLGAGDGFLTVDNVYWPQTVARREAWAGKAFYGYWYPK